MKSLRQSLTSGISWLLGRKIRHRIFPQQCYQQLFKPCFGSYYAIFPSRVTNNCSSLSLSYVTESYPSKSYQQLFKPSFWFI